MSAQQYVTLAALHNDTLETAFWLLRVGSEYVDKHGLSHRFSRALTNVASSVEKDDSALICYEASHRVETLTMFCDENVVARIYNREEWYQARREDVSRFVQHACAETSPLRRPRCVSRWSWQGAWSTCFSWKPVALSSHDLLSESNMETLRGGSRI